MNDAHEGTKPRKDAEELSGIVVDCGYRLHVEAGPGLLESVYEIVLAKMLVEQGLTVRRQVPVPINLMGMAFDEGFRADLLVENKLVVELKSVENLAASIPSKSSPTSVCLISRSACLSISARRLLRTAVSE